VEAEYALVRPDGRFADFTNTEYGELRPIIDALPSYCHPELRVGDAGIRVKNWYIEGDERFDRCGRSTGIAVKGIEIRTPVFPTIEQSIDCLAEFRSMLGSVLLERSWSWLAIGFNPCTPCYEPRYEQWERDFQASHVAHHLPQISTLSFGPDFNFSRSGDSPEKVLESVRRLTYYSPFIVPFSFSSPFVGGALWDGLSYRTYKRTGARPVALAHLSGPPRHPLVKQADPPSQHLRIEFKAFDMVDDDRLLGELFHLIWGICLADDHELPGRADRPDGHLHQKASRAGFDDDAVRDEAAKLVNTARQALRHTGVRCQFPLLEEMLARRRTPAHAMRETFMRTGSALSFSFEPAGPGAGTRVRSG
jgi:hypothetical protein